MGGRGASSKVTKAAVTAGSEKLKVETPKVETPKKAKLTQHEEITEYIKKQLNIDVTKARENMFDKRNGFNIDSRLLSGNEFNAIKELARSYGGKKISVETNGANRYFIRLLKRG